ncbi:unnamed protein product [Cylicocyclus nassatus]|uniref:G-protein coupled receptors family 1 profile domain-containing protein n=1 Tax=Cylicocyclus nassatus TaxID=53992 RepID=A0AA36GI77_CYLNA|nr:unnamed protein product [Cylicocyclus nassatus]
MDDWERYGGAAFMCTFYTFLGIAAAACNTVNLVILFSSKELRQRLIYLIALNIEEVINAISFILVGYGRGYELEHGTLFMQTTVGDCFFQKYWPHFLIIGTELPAYMMILISCERFFAVLLPIYYKRFFHQTYKYLLILTVPAAALISLMFAWLSAYNDRDRVVNSRHCFIIDSTGKWYSTFHFVIVVAAFFVSFLSFFVAWRIGKRLTTGNVLGRKHNLGLWMSIALSSTLLMSLPSFVMICKSRTTIAFNDIIVALTYAMPGFLSIANTIMNFAFHDLFRHQFLSLIRLRKKPIGLAAVREGLQHTNDKHHNSSKEGHH